MNRLVFLFALFLIGCGGDASMGDVSGTVSVDGGTPAEGSSITFIPIDVKSSGGGATLKDGRYAVTLPVGNYRVEIRVPRPMVAKKALTAAGPGGPGPGGPANIEESLPPKYHDKSELAFEVKPGSSDKNWELKSK